MSLKNALVFAALAVLLLSGCARDDRAAYTGPNVAKSDVALLKGGRGMRLDSVDHAAIHTADFYDNFGWNTVPVLPGMHKLVLIAHVRNGHGYIQDPWELSFRFEKGHTYEFCDNDDYGTHLKVIDHTTNQTMLISG
jgi:hypothetical protein